MTFIFASYEMQQSAAVDEEINFGAELDEKRPKPKRKDIKM